MNQTDETAEKLYDFIISYTVKNGFPPCMREMGDAVGLRSTSTVMGYVERLEKAGLIKRKEQGARAIWIADIRVIDSREAKQGGTMDGNS